MSKELERKAKVFLKNRGYVVLQKMMAVADVAELMGVTPEAVIYWANHPDKSHIPAPVVICDSGRAINIGGQKNRRWFAEEILAWIDARREVREAA